jgi:hypothetical protein
MKKIVSKTRDNIDQINMIEINQENMEIIAEEEEAIEAEVEETLKIEAIKEVALEENQDNLRENSKIIQIQTTKSFTPRTINST